MPSADAETPAAAAAVPTADAVLPAAAMTEMPLRRGLPRIPGGEPWPPEGSALVAGQGAASAAQPSVVPAAANATALVEDAAAPTAGEDTPARPAAQADSGEPVAASRSAESSLGATGAPSGAELDTVAEEVTLRQGLPRHPGGDPWPPAGTVTVRRQAAPPQPTVHTAASSATSAEQPGGAPLAAAVAAPDLPAAVDAPAVAPAEHTGTSRSETAGSAAPSATTSAVASAALDQAAAAKATSTTTQRTQASASKPVREPIVIGDRTLGQWVKLAVLWGGGAILAAAIIVLAARGVTTLPGVPEFMKRYPGEYHLPEFVDPGFPAWARWSHFLNFFLMVLIIRSGLLVRQQQKPDAFFTPKKGGKKVSIYLWLHTSLDIIWLANGVCFVVLLFISGHWARIVPTSWEVFPNAASAMLQYLTLEWPVENGWVNYNSLQQIMYFTVVFIAAPLAAITGVRMSEWWPKDAARLNRLYPAPVARAIHFPVMLFFVLFILIHVFLVFTTGALKNLNHMFVGTPEISWVGFWWFAAAVLVTAAVTWAARPLVLAPIAGAFGKVSER